ncbi:MAG: ATP-binding protein [Deltaproteobacteria bacterium]
MMNESALTPNAPVELESLFDPACLLDDRGQLRWANGAFRRIFGRRHASLEGAVGPELCAALSPIRAQPDGRWSEISGRDPKGDELVLMATAVRCEGGLLLLMRDVSEEARLHVQYKAMLLEEKERQRELRREIERQVRDHEDDLAQFAEMRRMGADFVLLFLGESRGQVEQLLSIATGLSPELPIATEALELFLRALHTLKGNARSFGFNLLSGRAHAAEDLAIELRLSPTPGAERLSSLRTLLSELDRLVQRADFLFRIFSPGEGEGSGEAAALWGLWDELDAALRAGPGELPSKVRLALERVEASAGPSASQLLLGAKQSAELAARDLGRAVSVELRLDADFRVRRGAAQQLSNALGHLVRNALAHGIETAPERARAGKPATGRLLLSASADSGAGVTFQIEDDGRGVDPAEILRVAKRLGLAPTNQQTVEMVEALAMLRQPGFSTSSDADQVSGRGVGLDAVEAALHRLGGRVSMASTPGQGTSIALWLPGAAAS